MIYTFIFVCETIEPSMWNWTNSVKVKHSMKNPSSPWSFLLIGTYLLLLSPQRKVNRELLKTWKIFSRLIYCNLNFQENVVKRCWISAEKVKKPLTFFYKMLHLQCLNTPLHGLLTTCSSFNDNFSTGDYFP